MATRIAEGPDGVILSHTTTRPEGDFAIDVDPVALAERRRAVADHAWVWLRQVHGSEVVEVSVDNATEVAGTEADALVTAEAGLVLAVQTADCVPVVLWSAEGVIAIAHAGWRGIEAGVVENTVAAMRRLGATSIVARTGPFIGPECYEFGPVELDRLVSRFGDGVRASTGQDCPALSLGAMTLAALRSVEVRPDITHEVTPDCTACRPDRWFSHRARAESERMATVVWREAPGAGGGVDHAQASS